MFVSPPTITAVSYTSTGTNLVLTVSGTNFIGPVSVAVNGGKAVTVTPTSTTSVTAPVTGKPILYSVAVTTSGGYYVYTSATPADGAADLNMPDFGNGLTLIPTPSVDLNQIYADTRWAFSERFWANTLGTDSSHQKLGAKFLAPEVSVFGVKGEIDYAITNNSSGFSLGAALECNILLKKVAYFDTVAKTNTSFNPFPFQPIK